MKKNENNDVMTLLRSRAEKALSSAGEKDLFFQASKSDLKKILHELEVYHVELEMQNDELNLSRGQIENERLRFANLFNLAPVGYFILDQAGVILECNQAGLSLLGSLRAKITGKRLIDFVYADDGNAFYKFIHGLLTKQISQSCQLKMRSNKGNLYVQLEGKYLKDPGAFSKAAVYYLAVIDVTEKRKVEIEQHEIKEQLQMALAASSTGTWHARPGSKEISFDRFAATILGLREEKCKLVLENIIQVIHQEDRAAVSNALQAYLESGSELDQVFRIGDDGATRYLSIKGKLITGPGQEKLLAGVLSDFTLQKKLEKEAAELKADQQKNILEAVIETQEKERQRISTILHDSVGQLLYAMGTHLEKNVMSCPDTQAAFKLLNQAIAETRNVSYELAPSLLTDFGLAQALKEMLDRLSLSQLKFSIRFSGLSRRLSPPLEIFIFRIVQELVNNVIKHAQATRASIRVARQENELLISVTDNGMGFYTQKAHNASGLHSIKNRISLYNGTLKIHSKKNSGTTVTVKLSEIESH